jgi:large conductance mechanosensitive channel
MSLISEFKTFAVRGNVIDLAVGVVIGGAFGKIVSSLVDQIIMPPIGLATGGMDFSNIKIVLREAAEKQPEVAIGVGTFINVVVQFMIVAFAIFMLVKGVNTIKKKEEDAPKPPADDVVLLREIRDLLKARAA